MEKNAERDKQLQVVIDWVTSRLRYNDVPRVTDVFEYAHQVLGFRTLKKKDIGAALRLHPAYLFNSSQQRQVKRWRKYRPIVTNALGQLHADLGFFSVVREYETPKTFRAGFLVAKDVLSRFTYAIILKGSKDADALVKAFFELNRQHKERTGRGINSISFDKETSVMGKKVQTFLRDNNIDFHAFNLTSSKSKFAEGAIRLIRTEMKRLQRFDESGKFRWWNYLQVVVDNLNAQPIVVDGKTLKFAPRDVNEENLEDFRRALHKAAPAYFFSQFDIAPQLVKFKFSVGSFVRPKLIVTSSEVVGNKRSETNLEQDVFVVKSLHPFVTRRLTVGKAYKCENTRDSSIEVFDEHDLAETITP